MKVCRRFGKKIIKILEGGGIGVIPTDTIYGLVGSALLPETVERLYRLRRRNPQKPMIVLIDSMADMRRFGMRLDRRTSNILRSFWPGPVSVVLPCRPKKFAYLHRGTKTLAFRLPAKKLLQRVLKATGPLVAPSANPEGMPVSKTILEAKRYFGSRVDFYVDAGRRSSPPSTVIAIHHGGVVVLRKGAKRTRSKVQ